MKGYQLIEPDSFLSKLIENEISNDIIIAMMQWLIYLLKNDDQLKKMPIDIDIIPVEYHGRYPCIGIHYLDDSVPDIGEVVLDKLERYHKEATFLSFYDYIINNSNEIIKNIDNFKNIDLLKE